jgi:nitronate monooxygenase
MRSLADKGDGMSRFTELVGCELPIQLAGMTRVATAPLAGAVSNAGGLGMVGIGRTPRAALEIIIDDLAALTTKPAGCTFIVRYLDRDALTLAAERLGIVELFYEWPDPALVLPGTITGWQVGSVDEARAAVDAGCDYVVAQGIEAGGHVRGSVPLKRLLSEVRDAVDVPVVAAGGIGSRAEVDAVFAIGADAVRIGTRFVAAHESDAHPEYVQRLVDASAADSVLTDLFEVGWPDAPHRVLASSLVAALSDGPNPAGQLIGADGSVTSLARRGATPPSTTTTGDIAAMALYAGRSVGSVTMRQPAADIVRELVGGVTQ